MWRGNHGRPAEMPPDSTANRAAICMPIETASPCSNWPYPAVASIACAIITAASASAQCSTPVSVPGTSNPFLAGQPDGATAAALQDLEAALVGKPWNEDTIQAALPLFSDDFTPLTDMRASAEYRLDSARNLLSRYHRDLAGESVGVLEVRA